MAEVGFRLKGSEHFQRGVERKVKGFHGAGFGRSKILLELRPAFFDGVEVRGIGWKVEQSGSGGGDSITNAVNFVGGKIVHDDNIARFELGTQGVVEESKKHVSVCSRLDCHRRNPAVDADRSKQCNGSPFGWGGVI